MQFRLEAQVNTQQYGGRPFGVGFLVAGIDVIWGGGERRAKRK
jgi:20S proteasome alpha/beta subunit